MTPAEHLISRVILAERAAHSGSAIKPKVIARTGVSDETYWRVLRLVNEPEKDNDL